MRSSALLDAFGGAICAAIAFPAGWWWCGVLSIVIMLINLGVKAHEVSVSSSIARSVATHVPQLEQQRTEAKKNAWSGRKLLVLVNPNAGSGRGGLIFNTCVVPLLTAAQIDYQAIHTERSGHAVEICSELAQNDMVLNGQKFDALVSVSGDGMIHEALQGFAQHCPDRASLARLLQTITLGIVPAGSGNGVAASLDAADPVQAVLNIVRGVQEPIDLYSVTRLDKPDEPPKWDVHFFCWAAFSDHDWLTERAFRSFGPLLKMIAAPLVVIARAWHYRGTVDLLPVNLSAEERADKHYSDPSLLDRSAKKDPAAPLELAAGPCANGPGHPNEWRTITADFWCFALGNLCFGGVDVKPTPHAERCEGALDLLIFRVTQAVNSGLSGRWAFVKMFLQIEKGTHIESDLIEMYKVRAVCLRPAGRLAQGHRSIGHMQCSGEELVPGDVLVQSHRGMLQMFVSQR